MKSIVKYRRINQPFKKRLDQKTFFKKGWFFSKLSLHFIPYTSYIKLYGFATLFSKVCFCYTFLKSVFLLHFSQKFVFATLFSKVS